jgi:uncharacterized protein (DUF58 family)
MTQQGVGLTVVSVLLFIAGRLLGTVELYILGAAALAAVALSLALVWFRRLDLDVHRTIDPPRVSAGGSARVDLAIQNLSRRRTPVIRLRDEISGTRGADLLVAPFPPGGNVDAAYRLPTNRRGVVTVGPISFEVTDPFGLARRRAGTDQTTNLIVLPPIEELPPVPKSIADDPLESSEAQASWSRSQGDFYALRQYVVGDDLRRVHWASTARHDDLLVRQDELPWQGRLAVVLDNRRSSLVGDGLDAACSHTASILMASRTRGDLVRLLTTDGTDSGYAAGNAGFASVLDHLAMLEPTAHGGLTTTLDSLRTTSGGGAIVVVSGQLTDEERSQVRRLGTRRRKVIHVQLHPSTWTGQAPPETTAATASGFTVTSANPFTPQWSATVAQLSASRQ